MIPRLILWFIKWAAPDVYELILQKLATLVDPVDTGERVIAVLSTPTGERRIEA